MSATCQILGRLTRDPEVKETPSGMTIARLGLVVNRKKKGEEEAHFFDATAFGKTAEIIGEHLSKGDPIFVVGELEFRQWEKDGQKRSKVEVAVNRFEFVPRASGESSGGGGGGRRSSKSEESEGWDDIPF